MKKFGFPILIMIFLIACLIFFICWADSARKGGDRWHRDDNAAPIVSAGVVGILLLILMIVWPSVYGSSIGNIARMRAFYNATKKVYEHTVKNTQEIEVKAIKELSSQRIGKGVSLNHLVDLGDLAYLKLGEVSGRRIKELRDKVANYNDQLETYRRWNEIFIARGFIANVPKELELITL